MQKLVRLGWIVWLFAVAAFVLLPVLAAFSAEPVKPPRRQVLFFCADWCGPCQQAKSDTAWMAARGWRYGANGHVRLVDADREPELVRRYGITSLPTFVLIERTTGRELRRSANRGKFTILNLFRAK